MAGTEILITAKDETAAAFKSVEAGLDRVGLSLAGMQKAMIGAAGLAGIGAMIKSQIDLGDQLAKTSEKLGISVENLSAYQYAAKLSGTSSEELQAAVSNLGKAVSEALGNPTSAAAEALRNLGLTTEDLKNKNLSQIFEEIAPKLAGISNESVRMQYQMTLLGKSGYELQPLLANLKDLKNEAIATGNVISTKFAKDAEAFKDSTDRLATSFASLGRHLATAVVPMLDAAIQRFNVMIGAQDQLSLDLMKRELSGLEAEYKRLMDRKWDPNNSSLPVLRGEIAALKEKIALQEQASGGKSADKGAAFNPSAIGTDDALLKAQERQNALWVQEQNFNAQKLAALDDYLRTEEERLQASYQKRQGDLAGALAAGLLTKEEYEQRETQLSFRYTQERNAMELAASQTMMQAQASVFGNLQALLQVFSGKSRAAAVAAIIIGKGLAIAQNIMATKVAMMRAFSDLGPIAGAPVAAKLALLGNVNTALIAATGLAQISQLNSNGAALGTVANPVATSNQGYAQPLGSATQNIQQLQRDRNVNITLVGDSFGPQAVRDLIEKINEQQGYGANITVMTA